MLLRAHRLGPAAPRLGLLAAMLLHGLFLHPLPAFAAPQSWSGGTPRAKSIEAIEADPSTPSRMWAACFGSGVARSLDGGATWSLQRTGLINTFVRSLAVQPNHPDSVYCGTNNGVFLSVDGGTTWKELLATSSSVRSIAIHPVRTGVVFAATYGSGIFKSTNGGATWSSINLGLVNTLVRDVVMDPAQPETLLAGTGTGGGIHRSVNGGLTWTQSPDSTANQGAVEQIQFDNRDPNLVYVATLNRGVLKSPDRGVTWVRVNRGLTNFNTRSIAVVDTLRYVGTNGGGVFFTTLSDSTWHPASNGISAPVVDALLSLPSSPGQAWAGTDGGGIFVTSDRGASWSPLDGGLLTTYAFSLAVRSATGAVYDGCGFGDQFWKSGDGGQTWTRASYLFSHDSEHGVAVDPLLPQTVYLSAYGAGVYRSEDDGATWFDPDSLGTLGSRFVRPLLAYPGESGHLFVGGGNGVYESLDGGANWTSRSSGLPASFSVRSLTVVPGSPPTLYAGSDSTGVWKSADGGVTWNAAGPGIPVPFIRELLADVATPLTVFAGTDSGLYRSADGGATWAPVRTGLPYGAGGQVRALAQDAVHPNVMFAGLYGSGVFESQDGGTTWAPALGQTGLGNLFVRALAVDGSRSVVYAGTNDGVWEASGYLSTVSVGRPAERPGLALAVAPNPAVAGARFAFTLPESGPADLELYDVRGARVRSLLHSADEPAGAHVAKWDGRSDAGVSLAPGEYFARLRWGGAIRVVHVTYQGR